MFQYFLTHQQTACGNVIDEPHPIFTVWGYIANELNYLELLPRILRILYGCCNKRSLDVDSISVDRFLKVKRK